LRRYNVYQSTSRYWNQLLAVGGSVTASRIFLPSAVLAAWQGLTLVLLSAQPELLL
jgi:hypothetical protein